MTILTETCSGCGGRAGHDKHGRLPYRAADGVSPLCRSCKHVQQLRGIGEAKNLVEPGAVPALVKRGGGVEAKDGAVDWDWRPPQKRSDDRHTDEIAMGGETFYQQAPPVHCKTSRPGSTNTKGEANRARADEQQRASEQVRVLLQPLTDLEREVYRRRRLLGHRRQQIAAELGMTETAVKKALERAAGKVRSAIVENELRVP